MGEQKSQTLADIAYTEAGGDEVDIGIALNCAAKYGRTTAAVANCAIPRDMSTSTSNVYHHSDEKPEHYVRMMMDSW